MTMPSGQREFDHASALSAGDGQPPGQYRLNRAFGHAFDFELDSRRR